MEEGLTRSDHSETLKWHVHESVTLLRCARLAGTHANLSDFGVVMCRATGHSSHTFVHGSPSMCRLRLGQEMRLFWDGCDQDGKVPLATPV